MDLAENGIIWYAFVKGWDAKSCSKFRAPPIMWEPTEFPTPPSTFHNGCIGWQLKPNDWQTTADKRFIEPSGYQNLQFINKKSTVQGFVRNPNWATVCLLQSIARKVAPLSTDKNKILNLNCSLHQFLGTCSKFVIAPLLIASWDKIKAPATGFLFANKGTGGPWKTGLSAFHRMMGGRQNSLKPLRLTPEWRVRYRIK